MFQMQPDGSVKVPVPFNAATQYNYIVLEYPTMPTAANPIENAAPSPSPLLLFLRGAGRAGTLYDALPCVPGRVDYLH